MVRKESLDRLQSRRAASAEVATGHATAAYNFLLDQADAFATMPQPHSETSLLEMAQADLARTPEFLALADAASRFVDDAMRISTGHWPNSSSKWKLPRSRKPEILSGGLGLLVTAAGLFIASKPGLETTGYTIASVGVTLIPGALGRAVKESVSPGLKPDKSA